jgi:hypothetical protein
MNLISRAQIHFGAHHGTINAYSHYLGTPLALTPGRCPLHSAGDGNRADCVTPRAGDQLGTAPMWVKKHRPAEPASLFEQDNAQPSGMHRLEVEETLSGLATRKSLEPLNRGILDMYFCHLGCR